MGGGDTGGVDDVVMAGCGLEAEDDGKDGVERDVEPKSKAIGDGKDEADDKARDEGGVGVLLGTGVESRGSDSGSAW
jgi:hypothetical protein